MPAKQIKFGKEARQKAFAGLEQLYQAVSVTLGPGGRNVLFRDSYGSPISTKDGVTVARRVVLKDEFEDAGAQLCKASANRAANAAGDGTTTATVLTWAMVSQGLPYVDAGRNTTDIRRGMEACCADLVKALEENARKITSEDKELVEAIASISGNSEELGRMVADAYLNTSDDAVVVIEPSYKGETYIDRENGFSFDVGYEENIDFITDPAKQCAEYAEAKILVTNKRIKEVQELAPFLDRVSKMIDPESKQQERPIVIIGAGIEEAPKALMVLNKLRANKPWIFVRADGFELDRRENLEDLAIAIGAEVLHEETQITLNQVDSSALGGCARIFVSKEKTTIIGGKADPEKLKQHIENLKTRAQDPEIADEAKKRLEERIARLSQGIAVIKIYAPTVADLQEQAYRYEDSILAVKAAFAEGVVPGGGTALVKCAAKLKARGNPDEVLGYELVKKAVQTPMRRILENAGCLQEGWLKQLNGTMFWTGWNARTGKVENLLKSKVLDPVKVTKIALEASVSTAAMYLTTECMIVEDPSDVVPQQPLLPSM